MSEKKYAIYLGCTVPVRAFNYELSMRKVSAKLGIELVDIPEFGCCGYPIEGVHYDSSMSIAAMNLALAEKQGLDIIALCSACTGHLTKVQKLFENPDKVKDQERINSILKDSGLQYTGKSKVRHFARVLIEDIGLDRLKEAVIQPLEGVRIAPHYGCHYVKPSSIFDGFDDPIHPETLDLLIEATGATYLDYQNRMQCCGGGILAINEETPIKMVKAKLDNVQKVEADAMTLICPFCNIMYDEMQKAIKEKYEIDYNIPVFFYPQLLGLAMGLEPKKDLGIRKKQLAVLLKTE
ncbi:MAG: CoB--CoM heterodisulfide reductase iron-sulfur subunit B family protein [Thermoplasmata archaeon]|nr:CoB--CoM heterodisulfide reductase iron-sulfur subunit B family protein [Thermoplasmata archaeon]